MFSKRGEYNTLIVRQAQFLPSDLTQPNDGHLSTPTWHQDALRKVKKEMRALGQELLGLWAARLETDSSTAAECVRQMARLGRPIEELQNAFLDGKRGQMEATLAAARRALEAQVAAGGAGQEGDPALASWYADPAAARAPTLHTFLVELNSRFLSELTITRAEYHSVFGTEADEPLLKVWARGWERA